MTVPHTDSDDVITLAELTEAGVLPLLTMEIMGLNLTDAGLSLVKAAGLRPGDPVWKLMEAKANLLGKGIVENEGRVIAGIEARLTSRKLRFGTLTAAVYSELRETAPAAAPEEPNVPVAREPAAAKAPKLAKTTADTPITLEEAERECWLLGLASVIELLEYPCEVAIEFKQNGLTHVWKCYEQNDGIIFIDKKKNGALWRKIRGLGLPERRSLAPDLVEKLKKDDVFALPPKHDVIEIPTDSEIEAMDEQALENLERELNRHLDRATSERARRHMALETRRIELENKLAAEIEAAETARAEYEARIAQLRGELEALG